MQFQGRQKRERERDVRKKVEKKIQKYMTREINGEKDIKRKENRNNVGSQGKQRKE